MIERVRRADTVTWLITKNALRHVLKATPQDPTSFQDLDIPDQFKLTNGGARFLLHDTGNQDPTRQVIYCSDLALQLLSTSRHLLCDATFKVSAT